jgi:V-type H+-transporting ATPase subunit C
MQCQIAFSDCFSAWVHVKAIRLFVESVLRYGLPVDFQAFLLQVTKGKESQLRKALEELYSNLEGIKSSSKDTAELEVAGGSEFYPYVYLGIEPTSQQ